MTQAELGVFVCDCGARIASVLDTPALEQAIRAAPGVAVAERLPYSCSPDGLASIQAAIARHGLERVLVAGCTPRTLGPRFRAACEAAGLNGDLVEVVDIREGCAWAHADDPQGATVKALDLIRMGAARLTIRRPVQPAQAEIVPGALVIGGGLAGMTAALTLADAGVPVRLVERLPALGGMLRGVHTAPHNGQSASAYVEDLAQAVTDHPRISVLLASQVAGISGSVGRYSVRVDAAGEMPGEPHVFDVGAIIVATGAQELRPRGRFRYDGRRVITQLEFEQELATVQGDAHAARALENVVMLLCTAQRGDVVPYCSGVCCRGALAQAQAVMAANPQARVTVLFRDLHLAEADEDALLTARQAGVTFMRYAPSSPPEVAPEAITVYDRLSARTYHLPYDRLVLATPLIPQPDAGVIGYLAGLAQDENGFSPDVRFRLRPREIADRGVYVCGAAHFPADWQEAEFQSICAAFTALRHLQSQRVAHHAPTAVVSEELCTGCGSCVTCCAFNAIAMRRRDGVLDRSEIDPMLCKGCGNCVVGCPPRAICLPLDSDAQMLAQIDEALAGAGQDGQLRMVVFGCEWSCLAAAELAGAKGLHYPVGVRPIRLRCSARFDPAHALWALFNGADGVFLGACPPGKCHYINGSRFAQDRFDALCAQLRESGFDPRRLRREWITPDDPADFVSKITGFAGLVASLGPGPSRSQRLVKEVANPW
jgi:heterodisulfide reductase subunit A